MKYADLFRVIALVVAVLEGWIIVSISIYQSSPNSPLDAVSHLNAYTKTDTATGQGSVSSSSESYHHPSSLMEGTSQWMLWMQQNVLGDTTPMSKYFFSDLFSYVVNLEGAKIHGKPHRSEQYIEAWKQKNKQKSEKELQSLSSQGHQGKHCKDIQWDVDSKYAIGKIPKFVRAINSYQSSHEDQLSFKKGDILILKGVPDTSDGGVWWYGSHQGREGYIPSSHIRCLDPPFSICRMLWGWKGSREEDLKPAGEYVLRLNTFDEHTGMWMGYSNGRVGLFPVLYAPVCLSPDSSYFEFQHDGPAWEDRIELQVQVVSTQVESQLYLRSKWTACLPFHMRVDYQKQQLVVNDRAYFKEWSVPTVSALDVKRFRGTPENGRHHTMNITMLMSDAHVSVFVDSHLVSRRNVNVLLESNAHQLVVAGGWKVTNASCSWKDDFFDTFVDTYEGIRVDSIEHWAKHPVADPTIRFLAQEGETLQNNKFLYGHTHTSSLVTHHVQSYRLFVGVLSTVTNYAARQAIRLSWMRYSPVLVQRVAIRFFVATMSDRPAEMDRIRRESETFGDIVISSFEEHYDNLALKTLAICKFAVEHVNADFLLKVDDDTFPRLPVLLEYLRHYKPSDKKGLYLGSMARGSGPDRNPHSKWYVTEKEYPDPFYPSFAHGPGYVLSRSLVKLIVKEDNLGNLSKFKLEDVSMGVWVDRVKKAYQGSYEVLIKHEPRFNNLACGEDMLSGHYQSPAQLLSIWWKDVHWSDEICG